MTAVPSHTDTLAGLPIRNISADSVDAARDFVSRNTRVLNPGPMTLLHERVTVTDATGFDLNSDLVSRRFGNIPFHEFEIAARLADLNRFHFRHDFSLNNFVLMEIFMESKSRTMRCQRRC
jgi:hypothetical protein